MQLAFIITTYVITRDLCAILCIEWSIPIKSVALSWLIHSSARLIIALYHEIFVFIGDKQQHSNWAGKTLQIQFGSFKQSIEFHFVAQWNTNENYDCSMFCVRSIYRRNLHIHDLRRFTLRWTRSIASMTLYGRYDWRFICANETTQHSRRALAIKILQWKLWHSTLNCAHCRAMRPAPAQTTVRTHDSCRLTLELHSNTIHYLSTSVYRVCFCLCLSDDAACFYYDFVMCVHTSCEPIEIKFKENSQRSCFCFLIFWSQSIQKMVSNYFKNMYKLIRYDSGFCLLFSSISIPVRNELELEQQLQFYECHFCLFESHNAGDIDGNWNSSIVWYWMCGKRWTHPIMRNDSFLLLQITSPRNPDDLNTN